jgi:hypothetical protein
MVPIFLRSTSYWSRLYKFRNLDDMTRVLDGFRCAGLPSGASQPAVVVEALR